MEGATWAAFAMATLSLAGSVFSNINARKANRDKLEFELKTKELEVQSAGMSRELVEVQADLAECRKQHLASEADRDTLRGETNQLRGEINELRNQLARLRG